MQGAAAASCSVDDVFVNSRERTFSHYLQDKLAEHIAHRSITNES